MTNGYQLSAHAIQQIREIPSLIRREVDFRMRGSSGFPFDESRRVRLAKTVEQDHTYPTGSANNYEVMFLELEFDDTVVGTDTLSVTELGSDFVRIAHSINPVALAEGTLVFIEQHYRQWYILNTQGGANVVLAQTPSGGIAARSGTSISSAECDTYTVSNDTLSTDGGSIEIYNLSADAIAGNTYVIAIEIGGIYFAIFEDCGGA